MNHEPQGNREQLAPRRFRGDQGFSTVEMIVYAPLVIALLMLLMAGGRVSAARIDVQAAAHQAARAASIADTPGSAAISARASMGAAMDDSGFGCAGGPRLSGNTYPPAGQQVQLQVRCDVRLADLTGVGVPGTITVSADAQSTVETYRDR